MSVGGALRTSAKIAEKSSRFGRAGRALGRGMELVTPGIHRIGSRWGDSVGKFIGTSLGRGVQQLSRRAVPMLGGIARFGGRNIGNLLNLGAGGMQLAGSLGTVQDEITVRITGGPRSDMKTLYRLAAAAAFGKVRRLVPAGGENNPLPPPGMIGIHYHLESREVLFMLRLNQSIMTITTVGEGAAALNALPIFSGPSMTTVGGTFDFLPPTAPGAPAIVPPALEFAGKVILTDEDVSADPVTGEVGPTKNHRPSGDARSRGTLVRMVTAALATPAEVGPSTFVLPNDTNRFTGG